jgi:hypothetical protein
MTKHQREISIGNVAADEEADGSDGRGGMGAVFAERRYINNQLGLQPNCFCDSMETLWWLCNPTYTRNATRNKTSELDMSFHSGLIIPLGSSYFSQCAQRMQSREERAC